MRRDVRVFTLPGTSVHHARNRCSPSRNRCSPSPGIGVQLGPESASGRPSLEPHEARGRPLRWDAPSPLRSFEQVWTFFYYLARRFQNLNGHGLLAHEALKIPHLLFELTHATEGDDLFSRLDGRLSTALDQPHPIAQNRGRDLQLTRHLSQRRRPRTDALHRGSFEIAREDATTVRLPLEFAHPDPPSLALS